jgi:acetoin utilization deacetylase AcuC-like enzyme/GNAT superfamily N-acetyltransferase
MFRIRQIVDGTLPRDRRDLEEIVGMLRERLPGIPERDLARLPETLNDPVSSRFRSLLFVADELKGDLKGFALVLHAPDLDFCLLDYIVTGGSLAGRGVGGALYQRAREAARATGSIGLFYECLPDAPEACSKPEYAVANAARLRFYARYGALPIVNTGYESPINPGDLDLPHLVYDNLDSGEPLSRDRCRAVVRAILERKYAHLCPPAYVDRVVGSITDDPVKLRPVRNGGAAPKRAMAREPVRTGESLIALIVNDRHDIHHVRERGYVEAPARVRSILQGIEPTGLFWRLEPTQHPEACIHAVHDKDFVEYLKRVCGSLSETKSVYPYVFPIRNRARPPKDAAYAAGYYCIDTFTPLNKNAYLAARRAVDCAMTAATVLLNGHTLAYALVRPPGHHAERRAFGGFCYFCNAAVAAHHLSGYGRVAMLDIDYHHGNGQQDIFYSRSDVLTVSIHGHPSVAYPFFTGFPEEVGEGEGEGFNVNIALPEKIESGLYHRTLAGALERIRAFGPRFLVVSLGFDTGRGDPTGTWPLKPEDFTRVGRAIGGMARPTLVVQEGGYRTTSLGANAAAFFAGLSEGARPSIASPITPIQKQEG